jgi:YesN/AraC family two-component response regulator
MSREWNLTVQFGQLLMLHAKAEHQVGFYADKLCITPYYLGTITRQTLNASPKTIIDRDIIRHLKTMLTTTDKSLNEIAEEMHFDDTSYMCKFFRKHTGMKMLEYRSR